LLRLDGARGFLYVALMSNAKGADKSAADLQDLPFEEALKRLETIVESMEAQDLPLETLLARYEEGSRLASLCQSKLTEAELKVQQLEKNAKGGLSLKPLATPEEME
jgi:exodeoxyribonuclease VII small subunit